MHTQEIINLRFDPKSSEDPVIKETFECYPASVLWCCIKYRHITNQYFNKKILKTGKALAKLPHIPWKYHDFLDIVSDLTNEFGKVCVLEEQFGGSQYEIDHEFWGDVFKALHHKRCFRIEVEGQVPTHTCTINKG